VLSFLQTILDSSLLSLLQYRPSHRVLARLLSQLQPELDLIAQMEQLRGPLEMFAKKAAASEGRRGESQTQMSKAKNKRQVHEQNALAIGLYRLEELVL
jgi:hypothetical protein